MPSGVEFLLSWTIMSNPLQHQPIQELLPVIRRPFQVGLVAAVVVSIYTLFIPNQYRSEARVLPADARSGSGGAAAMAAATVGVSFPGQDSPDAAYVDILNSRSLREALLQRRFKFSYRSWRFGALQTREQTLYDFLGRRNLDQATRALRERITITRDLKTKLLTLAVETESPELSQQVVQALVSLLDEFVVSKTQTRGGTKAAFAEKRLAEARREMAQAEQAFGAFLDSNRNFATSPDAAVRLKGVRLDNEFKLRTQIVTTLAIAREQALLEEKNDMPILNILDDGNLPYEKSRPNRGPVVISTTLGAMLLVFVIENRKKVRTFFAPPTP